MTVYGVVSGAYSDYQVCCLFATREDAAVYIDALKQAGQTGNWGDGYEIEEFAFFPAGERPTITPYFIATATAPRMDVSVREDTHCGYEETPAPKRRATASGPEEWNGFVQAISTDRDAAIKAVKDRVAAAKATGFEPKNPYTREQIGLPR